MTSDSKYSPDNPKHDKKELIHSLPDFIKGEVTDMKLKSDIENEILNSSDFRNEYELMRKTLGFLDVSSLESPDELYFTNLSVRINERLNNTASKTLAKQSSSIWKYLMPALSVILIAFLAYNYFARNSGSNSISIEKNQSADLQKVETGKGDSAANLQKTSGTDVETAELEKIETPKSPVVLKSVPKKQARKTRTPSYEKENITDRKTDKEEETVEPKTDKSITEQNLVADNYETMESESAGPGNDALIINDEEENVEDEFFNLTPEQQNEVLENLKQSQI